MEPRHARHKPCSVAAAVMALLFSSSMASGEGGVGVLPLERQLGILQAGLAAAEAMGHKCSLAVGNAGATLAFARMDGAPVGSITLALARQRTAALYATATCPLTNQTIPGGRYFDLQVVDGTATGPGGVPIQGTSSPSSFSIGVSCGFDSKEAVQAPCQIAHKASQSLDVTKSLEVGGEERAVGSVMTLKQAWSLVELAVERGQALGVKGMAVAVVDAGARAKASIIMDGCPPGYAALALSKARSAMSFDLTNTEGLNNASLPGAPAYGVQITNGGLFTVAGGAIVLLDPMGEDPKQALGAVAVEGGPGLDIGTATAIAMYAAGKLQGGSGPKVTLRERRGITTNEAQFAIRTAIKARLDLATPNTPGVYAVTDAAGHLRAFYSEDGAERGAADIALKSSKASAYFHVSSRQLGELSQPGAPLYNVELLDGGFVSFESSEVLIDSDGHVIGAIGVSGTGAGRGTGNDGDIARSVAKAVKSFTDPCALEVGYCSQPVSPVVPMDDGGGSSAPGEVVGLGQAVRLIDAVVGYAMKLEQSACTSVYDAAVRLKALMCQDDAFIGATDLTGRKARTAQLFGRDNEELQQAQLPGSALYKLEVTNGGLFMNAGGAPLSDGRGRVVGGVGVAGAADDAAAVAKAVKAWESLGAAQ